MLSEDKQKKADEAIKILRLMQIVPLLRDSGLFKGLFWDMKDYTYQDMLKMQEDAAVRVREMKRRAAIAVEEDNNKTEEKTKNVIPDQVKHISYPVEIENTEYKDETITEKQPVKSDTLKSDGDSMLILLILILISRDEADPLTSLALLYLLL